MLTLSRSAPCDSQSFRRKKMVWINIKVRNKFSNSMRKTIEIPICGRHRYISTYISAYINHSININTTPTGIFCQSSPVILIMKVLQYSAAVLSTVVCITSGQTWEIKFFLNGDCTPANVPIQQWAGTAYMNCRQLATVNGPSRSFKFNGANAFSAQVCRNTDCTDCDGPSCDSGGTNCVDGVPNEPYRSFLVTRDENCPGWRLN